MLCNDYAHNYTTHIIMYIIINMVTKNQDMILLMQS